MTKKDLGFMQIPVKDLILAPWNYKQDDENNLLEKLEKNILRNGQVENLLVRELGEHRYEVVNGNHRLVVLKKLKFKEAWCYNLGNISLEAAKRIAVETNETKFSSDPIKLSALLKDISVSFSIDDLVMTMPYSQEEIITFKEMSDFNWDEFKREVPTKIGLENDTTVGNLSLSLVFDTEEQRAVVQSQLERLQKTRASSSGAIVAEALFVLEKKST